MRAVNTANDSDCDVAHDELTTRPERAQPNSTTTANQNLPHHIINHHGQPRLLQPGPSVPAAILRVSSSQPATRSCPKTTQPRPPKLTHTPSSPPQGQYPPQGYQQPPPQQYGYPPQQMGYQQPPPQQAPPKQKKDRGCLMSCLAVLCCCFVCEEGCECCADCCECAEDCC